MKREETEQALEQISDRHIQEAINPKRKKRTVWFSAVAAVAAVAVLIGVLAGPAPIRANSFIG